MAKYYIHKEFKKIIDDEYESVIIFNAKLYKQYVMNVISTKEFIIPFDRNNKISVIDVEIPAKDDDSAILLLEFIDGGELVYGKR